MNILIITGKLAENTVKRSAGNNADVLVLDIEVAAFTTPNLLHRYLPAKKYDLILIPGIVSSDFNDLEKEIDTPIRLGPKHAVDIGFILRFAEKTEFSGKIPACELLLEKRRIDAIKNISELEERSKALFFAGKVKIGGNSRIKVMAEVVDAGHLLEDKLSNRISYFQENGADIIDLGMSMDTTEKEAIRAVRIAKEVSSIPLSMDTLDPGLINAGLEAGIDIVLSLNSKNMDEVRNNIIKKSRAAVIIPDNPNDIESLFTNIGTARNSGIQNLIADPVLEPAGHGLAGSISRYYEFRKRDLTTPLFFGAGNVTELIDADSIGVNAILSGIAMEFDAAILFTPEYSDKACGSVFELKTASRMMMLAKERASSPKDLGLDLLVLKEKRRREFTMEPEGSITAKAAEKWHLDPAGCFKIEISEGGKIIAKHKNASISGKTAREVVDTILEHGLVTRPDHAAYLGRELMKAELALKFKRSYSQDDEF
ncbi:MAG: dihydropteroate synthase-like protein [Candidatus Methanoperedens sp.]|nr:dihydropteroate synthase-like protein [Candidatus Methanoperedens sp.]MCE8424464.1 dihydropteroate synthase-like protein [Candidatus Methanoperedens sp.]MCE8426985.1 dihydropteroate synthase-like protein [Candidatus Methanoperedens sp.]